MWTLSTPGNRAPRGIAAEAGGCELGPRTALLLGDPQGADTLQPPQRVLLGGTEYTDRGTRDSQRKTLQGQKRRLVTEAGKNSASEAQGAGRPWDGVRLVKAARWQRGGEPRECGPCPPQGELGLELGSAGPRPRALPTGTSLCLKTKRLHE